MLDVCWHRQVLGQRENRLGYPLTSIAQMELDYHAPHSNKEIQTFRTTLGSI